MKKLLLSLAAGFMLLVPFASAANAQVEVRVGPRYHHHHYYRHHYYHHSHYYRHHYR